MKNLIGRMVMMIRTKDSSPSSSPPARYARLSCEKEHRPEIRRGYVPFVVGREEERFMVAVEWMKHPSIVALLQLSANEFGYHQEGVLHIPCDPHVFRDTLCKLSSKKK